MNKWELNLLKRRVRRFARNHPPLKLKTRVKPKSPKPIESISNRSVNEYLDLLADLSQ